MSLQDKVSAEDERRRQASFSELLLRHLVTGKCRDVGVQHTYTRTCLVAARKSDTSLSIFFRTGGCIGGIGWKSRLLMKSMTYAG